MKFNLKNRLIEIGLINEGWYSELQNKYKPSDLDFVKEEIKRIYDLNNYNSKSTIEANPLGNWMVSTISSLGGIENLGSKELNSARHAFETIIKFYILSKEEESVARNLTAKKPQEAFQFAKDEIEKLDNQTTIPEEIQRWVNDGIISIVPNGKVDENRFWIEVINKRFFDLYCASGNKYGVACQTDNSAGSKFVGGNYTTYTLLGIPKQSNTNHYETLMSLAADVSENKIIELKQIGNQQPGSTSAKGWTDLAEVAVDFLINNPKGKPLVKFVDFFTLQTPNHCVTYGGAGALCYWMNRKLSSFEKLISAKSDVIEYNTNLIINTLGIEYIQELEVDLQKLYLENPRRFISRIATYLGNSPDEVLDILKNKFDFEEFIKNYGEQEIFAVLNDVIKAIDFQQFMESVYPFINFDNFIKNSSEDKIREAIRELRNKENAPKKAFKIIEYLFEKHRDSLLNKFGGGARGLAKIINMFNTPRLEKHQNYEKKPGTKDIYSTVLEPERDASGRVIEDPNNPGQPILVPTSKLVQPENLILDPANVRKFLNINKEFILSMFNGNEEEKNIMFSKYIMANSSEQDRAKLLSDLREDYIRYYDEKYQRNENPLPGILQYTRDKEQFYKLEESAIKNNFDSDEKIYKFDKNDLKNSKYLSDLLKYYIQKSNANGMIKVADAIGIVLEQTKNAGFSKEEIEQMAFISMSPEKVLKKEIPYEIYHKYINNLLELSQYIGISLEELKKYANSDVVKKSVIDSKRVTTDALYKELLRKLDKSQINESKIRKYISNLIESKYNSNIKKKS